MKINDIMIGDWVNFLIEVEGGDTEYDGETAYYQPSQITTIAAWGVGNDGEVASDEGVVNDPDQLQPIPLTAEILLKNGYARNTFEYNTTKTEEWVSEDGRITMTDGAVIANSNNKWSVHIDNEDMQTIGYFELTYVHELQHALKLCGIDKEIEL